MMTVSFLRPDRYRMIARCRTAHIAAILAALVAGCAQTPPATPVPAVDPATVSPPPVAITSPAQPAVVTAPAIPPRQSSATSVESPSGAVAPARGQPSASQIATVAAVTPPGTTRYECVTGREGAETRSAITFPENSGRICARFPAMGPCQYERSACRARGGRVIRFDGVEITTDVEKEYDKQVQRFRLNAG